MSRFVRSRTPLLYAPIAAAAFATSSVARCEVPSSVAEKKTPDGRTVEFIGVFVDKASANALRAAYPTTNKHLINSDDENLFVVLKYQPSEEEKHAFAPILGRTAVLSVRGVVQDETTHAVLVDVSTEGGDAITSLNARGSAFPHVTLASKHGQNGFNSGLTSVLLERLHASGHLQWVLDHQDAVPWEGDLPDFDSSSLPLFNPFPTVHASIGPVTKDMPVIKGTVCTSTQYDAVSEQCVLEAGETKAECGFCKFMKAGPCGDVFSAWEACLDRCKKNGTDFIAACGAETLGLRDCVDAHPEYYSVLNESGESPEDEEQ